MTQLRLAGPALIAIVLGISAPTAAQDTPPPGSPAATGADQPAPDTKFLRASSAASINLDAPSSTPWWPPQIVPPEEAPNILLVIIDDEGFGAPSTFGGVIPTPTMDRARRAGPALHQLPFHRDLLVDPRRDHHRPQSPLGRLRGRRRGGDRLSRLQFDHPEGQGHDRHDPQGERLRRHRGSARTTTRRSTRRPRPAPSTTGRSATASTTSTASSAATPASGSRTSSATPRRSTPSKAILAGTSRRPWPTTRSST